MLKNQIRKKCKNACTSWLGATREEGFFTELLLSKYNNVKISDIYENLLDPVQRSLQLLWVFFWFRF